MSEESLENVNTLVGLIAGLIDGNNSMLCQFNLDDEPAAKPEESIDPLQ